MSQLVTNPSTNPPASDASGEPAQSAAQTGLLLVISGPSGVGKTTITHQVEKLLAGQFSVSMTTRPITAKDTEGEDYFFVDRPTFEAKRDAGELLEWAEVFGNLYGTPRKAVEEALAQGKLVILEIDVAGAQQVKQSMPGMFGIFVNPPSEEALLQRLRDRKREDEAIIQRRFAEAKREIAESQACDAYDHFIVNDKLDEAIAQAVKLVGDERQRRSAAES